MKSIPRATWLFVVLVASVPLLFLGLREPERISYSDFKRALIAGELQEVSLSAIRVHGVRKSGTEFDSIRVEDPDLLRELETRGVNVSGMPDSSIFETLVHWGLLLAPLPLLWWLLAGRSGTRMPRGALAIGQSKAKLYFEKSVGVRFSDVAGVDEAKEELREVIDFLRTPEKFRRIGGKLPKGVLLVGPPGTGKTLLARAVAGEAAVPFLTISGSEFVEMFVGVGAARVRDLFTRAKALAPCIIFIDELDALGKARAAGPIPHEERDQTLNQLLVEMDGFDPRVGVVLMAATNRPEILDPALLRAGRFDRHVLVDRPDKEGRLAILKIHARGVALEAGVELDVVASMSAGLVGADLANLVNEAALLAVRRGKETVGSAELQEAFERIVAGLEKRNRVLNRLERERIAHHEVGHALAALALPAGGVVQKISIIPRGISALGYTLQLPTEDRFLMTQGELEDKIAVLLGGRAAEEIVFGEISTGAQDDLAKATAIARSMVAVYGMSEEMGPLSFEQPAPPYLIERERLAPDTAHRIDGEVRRIVETQHQRVRELLSARREVLQRAAAELLEREVLTGDRLREIASPSHPSHVREPRPPSGARLPKRMEALHEPNLGS